MHLVCLGDVPQTLVYLMKENGFTLKIGGARNRLYPSEIMRDADYADDLTLLTNKPAQVKYLLYNLEQVGWSIGLYWNQDK